MFVFQNIQVQLVFRFLRFARKNLLTSKFKYVGQLDIPAAVAASQCFCRTFSACVTAAHAGTIQRIICHSLR